MNLVQRTGADFWRNYSEALETNLSSKQFLELDNGHGLEICFIAALDNLLTGLKENSIPDIFFAEVSLQQDY